MRQRTIKNSIEIVGIGLHKGLPVNIRLEPLEANMGIVFYRSDENVSIKLDINSVVDTKMATVIGENGIVISTIEHLLSAVYAYGIDNLKIVLDNDEVPILDGSSSGYCMLIEEAGIKDLNISKKIIKIKKDIEIKDNSKIVKLEPSSKIVYDFKINFEHPLIGEQHYCFDYCLEGYKSKISKARTFGFLNEVQYLRSIGLAKGGSLDNAIVLYNHSILNKDGLRYYDEFVRHKILDAIGDMSLLGYMVIGKYKSYAGSHHLNHLLKKKLLESKDSYEIIDLDNSEKFILWSLVK